MKNETAVFLQSLKIESATFKPAVIWERSADREHTDYQQMNVNHHFDYSMRESLNLKGRQFLLMDNRYLFASPELGGILSKSDLSLVLSEGFSEFA